MNLAEGVDVSHYQGMIDWSRVASAGKSFAFIKATEGTGYVDSSFRKNWEGTQAAGILRGAYHFFRPAADSVQQADHFLRVIGPSELAPVLDVEVTDNRSWNEIYEGVLAWVDRVGSATNRRPIIYTAPGFWKKGPTNRVETSTDLWVAHWGVNAPHIPVGWANWLFWQYTEKESVPGINGGVDGNRFNGDLAALRQHPHVEALSVTRGNALGIVAVAAVAGVAYLGYRAWEARPVLRRRRA